MAPRLPTVTINWWGEPRIINESEFNPATMTLFDAPPIPIPTVAPPPEPEPEVEESVQEIPTGRARFEAILAAMEQLDPEDEDLWTAITAAGRVRKPTVRALEDILGFDITGAERDEVVEKYSAAKHGIN